MELKRELKNVDELRFIFTSPTFIKEKAKKEKREFYIPRQTRERSLYGSEFEVKLRNEMTQRAIAKECAEWIRKKATFKSNVTSENMMGFMNVDSNSYMPINGFTTIDLGCERGNNAYYPIQKTDTPMSQFYLDLFEQIWNDEARLQEVTDEVIDSITTVYNENSPDYIYFVTLYNIFNEFLNLLDDDGNHIICGVNGRKNAPSFSGDLSDSLPLFQPSTGSYQQRTVIDEPIFLGTYEIPKSYVLSNIGLYFDENEFYIPEKLVIELCLV